LIRRSFHTITRVESPSFPLLFRHFSKCTCPPYFFLGWPSWLSAECTSWRPDGGVPRSCRRPLHLLLPVCRRCPRRGQVFPMLPFGSSLRPSPFALSLHSPDPIDEHIGRVFFGLYCVIFTPHFLLFSLCVCCVLLRMRPKMGAPRHLPFCSDLWQRRYVMSKNLNPGCPQVPHPSLNRCPIFLLRRETCAQHQTGGRSHRGFRVFPPRLSFAVHPNPPPASQFIRRKTICLCSLRSHFHSPLCEVQLACLCVSCNFHASSYVFVYVVA